MADNQYEDLEGYQYEVIAGDVPIYQGPDVVYAEQVYAEQSTKNQAVLLRSRWEGPDDENEADAWEILKQRKTRRVTGRVV